MKYLTPRQPFTGTPPDFFGAQDWAPGQQNPLQDVYHQSHGRALGDSDAVGAPDAYNADGAINAEEQVYPNELNVASALDDVVGNGIFDPANSQPQLHPDAGVFASHASQPGYLARERMFAPSEVLDINTGEPTVFTPANATYLDPRTPAVLKDRNLYEPGWPSTGGRPATAASTWIPMGPGQAISGVEAGQVAHGGKIMLAIAGVGVGILLGTLYTTKKKRRR